MNKILVNWCCMCKDSGEYVDHLLLHCPIAHNLWTFIFFVFGLHWVMLHKVTDILPCWKRLYGRHSNNVFSLQLLLCCEDNLERTEWLYSLGSSPNGDFSFILLIIKKEIKKLLKPIYLNKLIEGRSSQIISLYSKAWNVDYPHLKMLRCLYN